MIPSNQTHLLREVVVEIGKLSPFPQANGVFHGPLWDGFLKVMVPIDQTKSVITPRILLPLTRGSPFRFCHRPHSLRNRIFDYISLITLEHFIDTGNVENKWTTFQDGTGEAAFPAFAVAASRRQVAIFPCSRTSSTLRASNKGCPLLDATSDARPSLRLAQDRPG